MAPQKTEDNNPLPPGRNTVIIALAALLFTAAAVLGIFYYLHKAANNDNDDTEPPVTKNIAEEQEEPAKKPEAPVKTDKNIETGIPGPVFAANDFNGYWYSDLNELIIDDITDHEVFFSILYFRITFFEDITASIDGDTASFSYSHNDELIFKGHLFFTESSITVEITESNFTYLPVHSRIFTRDPE